MIGKNVLKVWCVGFVLMCAAPMALTAPAVAADPNDNDNFSNSDFPKDPDVSYANNLVSVSSDGHYAVSSNLANQIVLWDLQKHTYKIVAHHANSYSAYFIKHSNYFMWQSLPKQQLKLGTSTGAPPKEQLALVAQNKMGITSKENHINYAYFYVPTGGNFQNHIEKKPIPKSILNNYFLQNIPFNQLHADAYSPKFTINKDITSQMRFIQVLISLGYHSGNIVHVQDPQGHEVLHFDNFPVYGQVMRANLKDYFASSFNWTVFKGFGKQQRLMMLDDGGFLSGKLLNLSLSDTKPLLLTSGDAPDGPLVTGSNYILGNMEHMGHGRYRLSRIDGVTLWNSQTGHPIHGFGGNEGKTFATFSPQTKYIVAGGENMNFYVWNTDTFKRMEDWSMLMGIATAWKKNIVTKFNTSGLIKEPKDFKTSDGVNTEAVQSIKFIDQTHYLRFTHRIPYAVLFKVTYPKPLKYYQLGKLTPAIYDYSQDAALDTSPSKHILVMAMSGTRGGILEYQYNPKDKTLKRVWIGHFIPPTPIHKNKHTNLFDWL